MTPPTNPNTTPPLDTSAAKAITESLKTMCDSRRSWPDREKALARVLAVLTVGEFVQMLFYLAARQRAKETKPGKVAH